MSEDIFGCHNWRVLLASSGVLLHILQGTRQPPPQRIIQLRMSEVPGRAPYFKEIVGNKLAVENIRGGWDSVF